MRKLYVFDFDGTLTTQDTFLAFIRYAKGPLAFALGFLLHAPLLVLMKMKLYPNWKAKQRIFTWFFKGMSLEDFNTHCRMFALTHRHLLRPKGLEIISKAKKEGAQIMIVSASIENWIQPFFPDIAILGTLVNVQNGQITGEFLSKNCYGQEKVNRILACIQDRKQYYIIAYGDSRGDKEMLAFADEGHYKAL